jgi:hypothetical protein
MQSQIESQEMMFPDGPQITTVSALETYVVVPGFPVWIEVVFWLLAAVLAAVVLNRERSWASVLLCVACCCFAFRIVPDVISFVLPHSSVAGRLSVPLYCAQALGAALFAVFAGLRLRGVR